MSGSSSAEEDEQEWMDASRGVYIAVDTLRENVEEGYVVSATPIPNISSVTFERPSGSFTVEADGIFSSPGTPYATGDKIGRSVCVENYHPKGTVYQTLDMEDTAEGSCPT